MKKFIHKIHYSDSLSFLQHICKFLLWIASLFYGMAVNIRNLMYDIGILPKHKVPQMVISVGNLTTGGTGKTPVTAELAQMLFKSGKKTVILSRGYGGSLNSFDVHLISDGENVFYTAEEAGDEPYWHATNIKGVGVVTCKDRVKAAKWAAQNLNAEIFLLDDGFQYRRLERDLNIVLVDGYKKFGNGLILPAGPLREPLSQIKRADRMIVVNKLPYNQQDVKDCRAYAIYLIKKFNKEVFGCNILTTGIHSVESNVPIFGSKKVYAFTGVAQPDFFFASIKLHHHTLVKAVEFDDHYAYTKEDVENIMKDAKKSGADIIVTTEKDLVKIKPFLEEGSFDIPLYTSHQAIEMDIASLLKGIVEY